MNVNIPHKRVCSAHHVYQNVLLRTSSVLCSEIFFYLINIDKIFELNNYLSIDS